VHQNLCTNGERERMLINIFEKKEYRRILRLVCDNRKENWRVLTNKEIHEIVKKPTITKTVRVTDYGDLGTYREWKKIEFPKEYYI
jgi:hypothetical protein